MAYVASLLAFLFFLAGGMVMVSAVGEDGGMGWLSTNLPTTILWSLGLAVLAATVFATRNKAR
jgi:hypothetical protein